MSVVNTMLRDLDARGDSNRGARIPVRKLRNRPRHAGRYVLALGALAAVGGGVWWWMQQRRRTEHLRAQFGTEYDRALDQAGSRRDAEHDLQDRQKRMADIEIVELNDNSVVFSDKPADRRTYEYVNGIFG